MNPWLMLLMQAWEDFEKAVHMFMLTTVEIEPGVSRVKYPFTDKAYWTIRWLGLIQNS